ncbi:MAG: ABC transporter ATP-binding protein, partial [Planctomycetota bacterium]
FCLVGESGSGKSITAMSIMQLIPKSISSHPGDGRIVFHHRQDDGSVRAVNILEQDDESMRHIRGARISMIFQEPMTSLNPVHTIGDQIAEALLLHTPLRGKAMWARVLELLEMVEIPDAKNRMKDYPHRLSGGQRQRVMIAIAMACEPDLLIADEPTTALDVTIQAQILELMNELQRRKQMSILFITHDIGVVNIMADRVAVMQKGKIVEIGELDQVVRNPQHDYTKQLIAALPEQLRLERDAERERHAAAVAAGTEELTHAEQMMAADEPLVWMEQLQVYFPIRKGLLRRTVGYVKAVDNVDLTIRKGRILALVGESGSGKTTLGRAILRLVEPTGGSVYYAGSGGDAEQFAHADVPGGIGSNGSAPVELTGISLSAMRPFRRDLQFIFQDPYSSLNPRLRIVTTLTEPMAVHGIGSSRDERTELAAQMMVKMDLQRDMLFRYPHEFSGGQRQRIGMARALLLNPRFIVCDEVTSALDVSVQAEILRLLLQLREEFDLTLLFITHNIAVVEYLADEVAVMHQGKIVERGLADDVCRNPQHEYSQKLLSAVPRVDV